MNKKDIWPFFLNNKYYPDSDLIKYCNTNLGVDIKNIPKPLDDLVDAFFLLNLVRSLKE